MRVCVHLCSAFVFRFFIWKNVAISNWSRYLWEAIRAPPILEGAGAWGYYQAQRRVSEKNPDESWRILNDHNGYWVWSHWIVFKIGEFHICILALTVNFVFLVLKLFKYVCVYAETWCQYTKCFCSYCCHLLEYASAGAWSGAAKRWTSAATLRATAWMHHLSGSPEKSFFIPCLHFITCVKCGMDLPECPVFRERIQMTLEAFT